jgi:hypothetical protein
MAGHPVSLKIPTVTPCESFGPRLPNTMLRPAMRSSGRQTAGTPTEVPDVPLVGATLDVVAGLG